jgi:hypothetical protein
MDSMMAVKHRSISLAFRLCGWPGVNDFFKSSVLILRKTSSLLGIRLECNGFSGFILRLCARIRKTAQLTDILRIGFLG